MPASRETLLGVALDWFLLAAALLPMPAAVLLKPHAQMDAAADGDGASKERRN